MIFDTKKNTDMNKPRPRSILGTLFNPDIGQSMRPLGEAGDMFITILAMIFVMNGLLPNDHPAASGKPGTKISLTALFRDAHNRLSYDRDGMPKVILFYAVVGCLIFSGLTVLTFVLSLFVGKAHASSLSGFFTVQGQEGWKDGSSTITDLALGWLGFLFYDQPMPGCTAQSNQSLCSSHAIQDSLQQVLGYYSEAVLIFAAVILFYHLAAMIIHTAHHGVPMGKNASQIWAPIRLVVAIALLVPIGTPVGLNAGQNLLIQIAGWGSALASNVWQRFVNNVHDDLGAPYVLGAPAVTNIADAVLDMQMCKYFYNYYVQSSQDATNDNRLPPLTQVDYSSSKVQLNGLYDGVSTYYYKFGPPGAPASNNMIENVCGSIAIPNASFPGIAPASENTAQQLYVAQQTALRGAPPNAYTSLPLSADDNSLIGEADHAARILYPCFIAQSTEVSDPLNPGKSFSTDSDDSDCQHVSPSAIATYSLLPGMSPLSDGTSDDNTDSNLSNATGTFSGPASGLIVDALQSDYTDDLIDAISQVQPPTTGLNISTSQGWISAGAYFNNIAQLQADIERSFKSSIPKILVLPTATSIAAAGASTSDGGVDSGGSDYFTQTAKAMARFHGWLEKSNVAIANTTSIDVPTADGTCNMTVKRAFGAEVQALKDALTTHHGEGKDPIDYFFRVMDHLAAAECIWKEEKDNTFTLGLGSDAFSTTNPLAAIAHFGHANLNMAYSLFGVMLGGSVGKDVSNSLATLSGNTALKALFSTAGGIGALLASMSQLFGLVFFLIGFTLAFFLPLLPFIVFFFHSVGWIVLVLEGIVMMPLVALAHLNPEGEGLPGAKATVAYSFIFSIMLRPVLMIFGLICSLLVFMSAVFLLNTLFQTAAISAGGASNGHVTMARIIFTVMYVILLYIAAKNSFKLIGMFPDHAMQWMGQQAKTGPGMGEPDNLGAVLTTASGWAGEKLATGADRMAGHVGKGFQDLATHRVNSRTAQATNAHNAAMLNATRTAGGGGNSQGPTLTQVQNLAHPPTPPNTPTPANPSGTTGRGGRGGSGNLGPNLPPRRP